MITNLRSMSLKEKIANNLKDALKAKRELEVSVLRMLQAAILNREKEKRAKIAKEKDYYSPTALPVPLSRPKKEKEIEEELEKESQLTDEEIVEVISSEVKKRREAIEGFEKGKREDLVEKEKKELEVLEKYLPEQLSEEEIKKLAKEAVEKTGAAGPKDMGKVMAELMPKVKGRAEGSLVSKIVKELLS